ncbi:Hypothetical predicted protein [Podarcis lilfordi]|uniref:Uncharacterized protein n=1 Tax=Podarcis lilfordi TaxID=74358 RepID=A0AA35LBU6_9SAUR|nr:Hypothetical predicted protein [Podarcis lilfordi]
MSAGNQEKKSFVGSLLMIHKGIVKHNLSSMLCSIQATYVEESIMAKSKLNQQGPDNYEAQSLSRGQQLVNLQLTPNNICLNIALSCFPYYAWRNRKAAVISLRMLTRSYLAQGGLLSLEWLPETPKFKHLLLKFDSPRLPALLSKLQNRLNWFGIFPQRCFFNNCRGIIGKIPNSANLVSQPTRRTEDRNSQQRTLPMNPSPRFTSRPPHRQEGTALRGRALTGPALATIDASKEWQTQAYVDPPAAKTISNPQNGCIPCADTMTMQETLGNPVARWTNTEAVARLNKLLEANRKGCLSSVLHSAFPSTSVDPQGTTPATIEHTANDESMDLSAEKIDIQSSLMLITKLQTAEETIVVINIYLCPIYKRNLVDLRWQEIQVTLETLFDKYPKPLFCWREILMDACHTLTKSYSLNLLQLSCMKKLVTVLCGWPWLMTSYSQQDKKLYP